jgi:16S rRNA processing protein RimM
VTAQVELIKIGQITSPHGIRGEVRLFPLIDVMERFEQLTQVLLGPDMRAVTVHYKGMIKNMVILKIEGVESRNQAEELRLQYMQVPKTDVPALPKGSYYLADLIGLHVIDLEGNPIGKLVEVDQSSPAHDLYVVETAPHKRFMVPAVKAFVREISLEKGHVVIAPVPGLFEE